MTARRRLRRRLLLLGLLPLLLAVALATKVVLTYDHAAAGRDALGADDADAARAAYGANATLNVLEPWVAPYDEGIAAFRQDEPADAARLFARALEHAPTGQECRVRTNLALALEAAGDAAVQDEVGEALRRWGSARESLAPCLTSSLTVQPELTTGLTGTAREQVVTVDRRVAAKITGKTTEPEPPDDDLDVKGKDADFSTLTPTERRRVLQQRQELASERRTREQQLEQAERERRRLLQLPPPDEPVYNW